MQNTLRNIFFIGLLGLSLLPVSGTAFASADITMVKGIYLYNFIRYTQWPIESKVTEHVEVAVFGSADFSTTLKEIAQQSNFRPTMKVSVCQSIPCEVVMQVAFIHHEDPLKRKYILDALTGNAVLTVSDQRGFLQQGGMIEVLEQDGHLVFSINLAKIKKEKLYISADILQMAQHVIQEEKE